MSTNDIDFDNPMDILSLDSFPEILEEIKTFKIPTIKEGTRFWMIRTKKGYFYNEFVLGNFVALAWNSITSESSFTEEGKKELTSSIGQLYPDVKRPSTVINKCQTFISEIKVGDYIIIPSAGSKKISFAIAGEYYEDSTKTYEIEKEIINNIETHNAIRNNVSCPYRKRRHITHLLTLDSDKINHHVFRAITSYHGICNLDDYSNYILDHLYSCYTFAGNTRVVFHVTKTDPITSKEFSGLIYSANEILSMSVPDENLISTQASVHSVGDVVFNIVKIMSEHQAFFIIILLLLCGGKGLSIELPGIAKVISSILSIKVDHDIKKEKLTGKKLDNYNAAYELVKKLEKDGITLEQLDDFKKNMATFEKCSHSMQVKSNHSSQPISYDSDNDLGLYGFLKDDEEE